MKRYFAILFLLCSCLIGNCQQGNYKYNQYGNRSILLTGNVTGSVSDIGLTYYNPARLSLIENNGFAFNARAYQYNSIKVDPIITDGDALTRNSLTGVPSLVGGTFNLFNQRFGYVFLSKYRANRDLTTTYTKLSEDLLNSFPDAQAFSLSTSLVNDIRDDWYGLSWAKKIDDRLSFGISIFGTYYKYRGFRSYNSTFQYEPNQVSTDLYQYSFNQRSYGFNTKIGADYKINNVDIGLNLNLPYLEVYSKASYNLSIIRAGSPSNTDVFYDYEFDDVDARRKLPFGISAGAGIQLKKNKIHLNIDYMANLPEYVRLDIPTVDLGEEEATEIIFNDSRKNVLNFGLGGELYIKDNFSVLFGFSTDFDSYSSENTFFDFSTTNADELGAGTDYYHLSGGIDWTLKWASIIFGLTYTTGTSTISVFNEDLIERPGFGATSDSAIRSSRVQFVIGFEIPFIDAGVKSLRGKTNMN